MLTKHAILTLSETAKTIEAWRIGGKSNVRLASAWYVQCYCGWVEKANTQREAKERFDRHDRGRH